jgi:hypothetical protein
MNQPKQKAISSNLLYRTYLIEDGQGDFSIFCIAFADTQLLWPRQKDGGQGGGQGGGQYGTDNVQDRTGQ